MYVRIQATMSKAVTYVDLLLSPGASSIFSSVLEALIRVELV